MLDLSSHRPFLPLSSGGRLMLVTPNSEPVIRLLGGMDTTTVVYTEAQAQALGEVYDLSMPRRDRKDDMNDMTRSGAWKTISHLASRDGLRVMAALAPYLEKGEDPVQLVLEALAELGYDAGSAYEG